MIHRRVTRGEVWWARLDPVEGSEQAGTRPVVIVQSDLMDDAIPTALAIPLTTALAWSRSRFCVLVPVGEGGLTKNSLAMCHQMRALSKSRLLTRIGKVGAEVMDAIDDAIRYATEL